MTATLVEELSARHSVRVRRRTISGALAWKLVAACAILLGLGLRWAQLSQRGLWFDEGYTAWVISLPPAQIVSVIRADTAPPLYYLLLHGWTQLLVPWDHSESAMRSLSALCASAALLLSWHLARRLLVRPPAVVAALALSAVSFLPICYAHDARFYAPMALLSVANFVLIVECVRRPASPLWLAAMVLLWTASLYTSNVLAVYLAASAGAWLLLPGIVPLRRRLRDLLCVSLAAGGLYLPWVPTLLHQLHAVQGQFWLARPDRWTLLADISRLAGVNEKSALWGWWRLWMSIISAAVVLAVAVGLSHRASRRTSAAIALLALGPVLALFCLSRVGRPIFIDRAFLPSTPLVPLLLALPLTLPGRTTRLLVVACIAILLVLNVASLRGERLGEFPEDWRGACAFVATLPSPAGPRLTVFAANEGELLYDHYIRHGDYAPQPNLMGLPADFFSLWPPRTMRRVTSDADLNTLRQRLAAGGYSDVIFIESHSAWADPAHRVRQLLAQRLQLAQQRAFRDVMVSRYLVR